MLTQEDRKQIAEKGISEEQLNVQLKNFETGFPYLRLEGAASVEKGIMVPDESACIEYKRIWGEYKKEGRRIVKFVPASGAASRMFKDMFAFLDAEYNVPTTSFEKEYFANIHRFAFYDHLDAACKRNEGKGVEALIATGKYKSVVANMLGRDGLNYGGLPKGLLLFHDYEDGARTSLEEHLVEAALYADSNGKADIHFTVSHEHLDLFKAKVAECKAKYEARYGVSMNITFSEQKPSTDTVAANPDNTPFRNEDGSLLFRPGGHGALIENLNDIDADIIFVKNIDNVVPDRLKRTTVEWKNVIAGILVALQRKVFGYLEKLDNGNYQYADLEEMLRFVQHDLCCCWDKAESLEKDELVCYLRKKLNRPMRVCGMVRNSGEPGGGPFLTYNTDGTVSLQILESSQINTAEETYAKMFRSGTHFNPVDLVCAVKDYKGRPFCLPEFVDKSTGFISLKSKNGRELKALELPGLWNGAMSDWNTVFVEVPLATFNPVKTVNDLLREQHQ